MERFEIGDIIGWDFKDPKYAEYPERLKGKIFSAAIVNIDEKREWYNVYAPYGEDKIPFDECVLNSKKNKPEQIRTMKLNYKDNNDIELSVGDEVSFITITDDSGRAVDIYGVEPHLDGWVENVYLEMMNGEIIYNEDHMMYQIDCGYRKFPLSPELRSIVIYQNWERLNQEDINEFFTYNKCNISEIISSPTDKDIIIDPIHDFGTDNKSTEKYVEYVSNYIMKNEKKDNI